MENTDKNTHNLDDYGKSAEENADRLRQEGNESFRVNDFKKALELYTKSLEVKKTVPALLNRSFSNVKMERFEEALSDADDALLLEPDNLKGKCRRGIALRELGRYSLALKEFGACLEREPDSGNFQQLYDNCQALSDQKLFVNMKLQIVGYKDPKSGRKLQLKLIDGLPSPTFPHIKHEAQSFRSLAHLEAHIKENVKGVFGGIRIEDSVVDEELMQFFRSLDPAMLASIQMEFYNVECSGANFAELYSGRLFRPLGIWFSQMERTEMDLTTALVSFAIVQNAKNLQLNETRFERFFHNNVDNNAASKNCLDMDTVLDLLHQPLPDIPAHIRASPNFFDERLSIADAVLRGERSMTANESITLLRAMAGRTVIIDHSHFGGGEKLAEIIQKCTQRFQLARSPVAYMLHLRIPWPPQPHLDTADFATLSGLVQQKQPTVVYNGAVGEKLTVGVLLGTIEFEPKLDGQETIASGNKKGQLATISITRVCAPPPPNDGDSCR